MADDRRRQCSDSCSRPPAGAGERIHLGAPSELAVLPFGGDEAGKFQLVQGRIEGPLADLPLVARYLLQALADRPAVQRLEREDLEEQEVECPLHEIGRPAHRAIYLGDRCFAWHRRGSALSRFAAFPAGPMKPQLPRYRGRTPVCGVQKWGWSRPEAGGC
jgi:hypothetical protein